MYDKLEESRAMFIQELAKKKYPDYKWRYEGDGEEEYNKNKALERQYDAYVDKLWNDLEKKNSPLVKDYENYVVSIIKKYNPVSNDLERALNTKYNNEYLVTGNAYYGVQLEWMLANPSVFEQLFKKV